MKKPIERRKLVLLISRYTITLLLGLFISLFYKIFTPLTLRTLYLSLSMISDVHLFGYSLVVDGFVIDIIPACVSGSAYYLLFVLNMLTPMSVIKRFLLLLSSFFMFFVFTILRILFLIYLLIRHTPSSLYGIIHKLLWFFVSTLLVLFIWLLSTRLLNIKEIPLLSDVHHILNGQSEQVKRGKKKK